MRRLQLLDTLEDIRDSVHSLVAVCRHTNCRYQKAVDLERMIQRVGVKAPLVPRRAEIHFSDQMRCPSCKRRGMNLFLKPGEQPLPPLPPMAPPKLPNFTIVDTGRGPFTGHDVIATADNLMVARGAFSVAAHFYPDRRILLKQGAFVVADTAQEKPEIPQAERIVAMREAEINMGNTIIPPLMPKAS